MKYLTQDESLEYTARLEELGFDLNHWEFLENEVLLCDFEPDRRLGDAGFDLMDFRDAINQANEEFGI